MARYVLITFDAYTALVDCEAGLVPAISEALDEEMLRALAASSGIDFDHILASDHAGHYKPHPSVYALPRERLRLEPREVLHVAGSGNDVLGCKLAGLPCAWSNRHGDRMIDPGVRADREMRDLAGLLEFL